MWGSLATEILEPGTPTTGANPDVKVDLLGLGTALYLVLSGRPYSAIAVKNGGHSLRAVNPDVPEHIDALCARLLAPASRADL